MGHVARLATLTTIGTAELPDAVARSVELRVLDIVGLCLAATRLETSMAVAEVVRQQGTSDKATAIGAGRTSVASAAFMNGVLAHSLDYDDTHLPSVLHPSASVVPAVLAVAEELGVPGERLVPAIAAGLEICVRLGMAGYDRATGNSIFFEHGQHATSICGAVGAAAAAAALHGPAPDAQLVADAMGIAVSMASGVIEANRTGGTVKRIHCGWAAQSGVMAAQLAAAGITGPPTALEGRFGFFQAFLRGSYDEAALLDGLGVEWEVPSIFFKPYPANHFTHTIVDAARRLRAAGLRPEDVESVRVGVPTPVVRTVGEPLEAKRAPLTGYQAQFSAPYAVAVGLFGGGGLGACLDDYSDALATHPARRALMATVHVEGDARCDKVFPHQFPAVLTVHTRDRRVLEEAVLVNRGGPQDPLSEDELCRKFRGNSAAVLEPHVSTEVERRVLSLREATNARAIMQLLSSVPTAVRP